MNLEKRIDWASGELPEGWNIILDVENGSAWVSLTDPDGNLVDLDTADMSLSEMVEQAVIYSKAFA